MARSAYVVGPEVRQLRSLVGFAESDRPAPALAAVADLGHLSAGTVSRFRALSLEGRQRLRHDLRAFLRAAAGEGVRGWRLGSIQITAMKSEDRIVLFVGGDPTDVTLYTAAALLRTRIGTEPLAKRLRLCPAPDCGRAFVKIGRREFCSTRCQRRVFLSTYDPFDVRVGRKGIRHHGHTATRKR
jgi:hypothetical protein